MRIFLFLVILLSASMACNATVSQQVPAVFGNGGSMVDVTVELVPGQGDVFVKVYPRTGISTQESIELAVAYARFLAKDNSSCDVMVSFGRSASLVDGPSAGTAMTVMTYAALENKSLRHDTVLTGTIDIKGSVGPVGGLYEKAKGAASIGASYFITPVENFYEMLLLRSIEDEYGLEVIEARNVAEVIGFMTENKTIEQTRIGSRKREILNLTQYDDSRIASFRNVSQAMIDLEQAAIGEIAGVDNETREIIAFFDNEVERQQGILRQGYVFSSANEAFLNYIDLVTINAILENNVDLPREKGDVSICLSRLERPDVTNENFEWVVGSDLRGQWASDRIRNTDIESPMLAEEKFVKYNELAYGQAWCHVASSLLSAAPSGGEGIDESQWEPVARRMLAEARELEVTGELASRLAIAENSYGKGLYGAAIFDSVFVITSMEAQKSNDTEAEIERLFAEERTTLWGQVYQSHAAFLYELNETNTAYRTLLLAEGLEYAALEMSTVPEEKEVSRIDGQIDIVVFAAIVSMFILFVLLILILRRVHGNKRGRKTYRTSKKKRHS
jgi:hypothetical protein